MSYKCFLDIHSLRENANKINRCRLLPEDQVVYERSLRSPPPLQIQFSSFIFNSAAESMLQPLPISNG